MAAAAVAKKPRMGNSYLNVDTSNIVDAKRVSRKPRKEKDPEEIGFIYVVDTGDKKGYKVGKHGNTKKLLLTRYKTSCTNPKILVFLPVRKFNDADKAVEKLLKEAGLHLTREFYKKDLQAIFQIIESVRKEFNGNKKLLIDPKYLKDENEHDYYCKKCNFGTDTKGCYTKHLKKEHGGKIPTDEDVAKTDEDNDDDADSVVKPISVKLPLPKPVTAKLPLPKLTAASKPVTKPAKKRVVIVISDDDE